MKHLTTALHLFSIVASLPTSNDDLLVKTQIGTVQGRTSNVSDTVRFFGNIPYAEPPVGNLRWRSPIDKLPISTIIDGTDFGPSCVQYDSGAPTVYSEYLTGFLLRPGQPTSEDCLTLNVWAPRSSMTTELLPVMIWIHGGGFTSGGAASPFKYGDYLVVDHQDVIVVAINYRLNLFGFPDAAALQGIHLNPGLEDQRKAVEWIYRNIEAFGGDKDRMILFGQSAGGSSVDKYFYAYAEDPLVQGFIPQSGMADLSLSSSTGHTSNFTYLAQQFGCNDTTTEFECLQQVNATDLIEFVDKYNASKNGGQSLSFTPVPDNITVFSNYTDLRARGFFAQKPSIISQVNNEGASLLPYNGADHPPNQTAVDAFTCGLATRPDDEAAVARQAFGLPLWRTRYFGVWPNLNPLPWLGSYHSSDLPMIFGTYGLLGPSTSDEVKMSQYYQNAWVAFAKDPVNGLTNYGWPTYNAITGDNLVELGMNGSSFPVTFGSNGPFDTHCSAVGA